MSAHVADLQRQATILKGKKGPASPEAKQRVKYNALRHGFTGQVPLVLLYTLLGSCLSLAIGLLLGGAFQTAGTAGAIDGFWHDAARSRVIASSSLPISLASIFLLSTT